MTTKRNNMHTRTFRSKKLNQDHIKILNEAIRHNAKGKQKDVHLTYQKENGEVSERKVRPLAVKDKSLFVAHCHERNALRSFRVERIQMVKSAFWDGFEKQAENQKEKKSITQMISGTLGRSAGWLGMKGMIDKTNERYKDIDTSKLTDFYKDHVQAPFSKGVEEADSYRKNKKRKNTQP